MHNFQTKKLSFIQVYRHGARNPISTYKNDPYKNRTWPGGLGALSTHGSVQMYTLGKYLRQRYLRLLPADGLYSKENMQIISSAEERSIMSAESFMASFLRPSPKNSALKIPWQPAAITTIPGEKDNVRGCLCSARICGNNIEIAIFHRFSSSLLVHVRDMINCSGNFCMIPIQIRIFINSMRNMPICYNTYQNIRER